MPAHFVADSDLNAALEDIFKNAKKQLILISPYIKLHDRLQAILKTKLTEHDLLIQVVFGKNEEDPRRSMGREDLEFFMQFPNIEIKHERRLHAKYYTNDFEGLITSMNLYSYSQDNNIESGILTTVSAIGDLANQLTRNASLDDQALDYFERVVKQASLIYKKVPEYEKIMLGLNRKYIGSKVVLDDVAAFFSSKPAMERQRPTEKPDRVSSWQNEPLTPPYSANTTKDHGYCIHTGVPIPFNVKQPLCDDAYRAWCRDDKVNRSERFCHFTGEPSNGENSYAKPVLWKNWAQAKAKFHL